MRPVFSAKLIPMTSTHVLHPPTLTLDKVHASSEGKGPRTMALASFPPNMRISPSFRHQTSTKNTNLSLYQHFLSKPVIKHQSPETVMVMLGAKQVILWYGRKAKSFNIDVGKVLLVSGKYLSAEKCREFSLYSA